MKKNIKNIAASGFILLLFIISVMPFFDYFYSNAHLDSLFASYSLFLFLIPIDIWIQIRKKYCCLYDNSHSIKSKIVFWFLSLSIFYLFYLVMLCAFISNYWLGILWNLEALFVLPLIIMPIVILTIISYILAKKYYGGKSNFITKTIAYLSNRPLIFLGIILTVATFLILIIFKYDDGATEIAVMNFITVFSVALGMIKLEKKKKPYIFTVKYCLCFSMFLTLFYAIYIFIILPILGSTYRYGTYCLYLSFNSTYENLVQSIIATILKIYPIVTVWGSMLLGSIYLSRKRKKLQG